ncbi:uncharacterized protein LOC132883241 isoform X2 [Neoarius graeffei]|uniref:uncharacterized protein LOC132883241 isoform X2 n=1 Tax=Neoarius graeffei TaxID=443677 RepID=UPI00298CA5BA|nr:uncharacterized protein LOC132883241 isoform X2 [Neoarius graeffei]
MSGGLSKICKQSMLRLFRAHLMSLKSALQTTRTLGLPDPNKPFVQTVDEKKGFMTSVLLQKHGDRLRPVAYFSSKLDPVAAGLPVCLRAVAAAEKAVTASRNIVGYSNLTLLVPHAVSLLLLEKKTSHLSAQRWLKYNTVILDMPNIIVKHCSVLNSASLLPTEDDGEPHDCVVLTNNFCSPRTDLKSDPLENPDMVLYVDGSASRNPETGKNKVGFAVVSGHEVLKASCLSSNLSAQAEPGNRLAVSVQTRSGFVPRAFPVYQNTCSLSMQNWHMGSSMCQKGGMVAEVTKRWFTKGFSNYIAKFCKQCLICAQHNAGQGIKLTQAAHPIPDKLFDHLQMDFIELTLSEGKWVP